MLKLGFIFLARSHFVFCPNFFCSLLVSWPWEGNHYALNSLSVWSDSLTHGIQTFCNVEGNRFNSGIRMKCEIKQLIAFTIFSHGWLTHHWGMHLRLKCCSTLMPVMACIYRYFQHPNWRPWVPHPNWRPWATSLIVMRILTWKIYHSNSGSTCFLPSLDFLMHYISHAQSNFVLYSITGKT